MSDAGFLMPRVNTFDACKASGFSAIAAARAACGFGKNDRFFIP
ncbi:hypothetical protein [Pseudomonas sp. SWRI99]|nr:hypothetical protein [Pseudomonas sp. SWRI99]